MASVLLVGLAYLDNHFYLFDLEIPAITSRSEDQVIEQLQFYATLLTAIFSIYFATLGIIVSTGYIRFRRDIIYLLTTEQVGSAYTQLLVFTATLCILATFIPDFGLDIGYAVYFSATILTIIAMLSLFPLGQRSFNFFDVVALIENGLLQRQIHFLRAAAKPGITSSIAYNYQKQARQTLEQINYIDDQVKKDPAVFREKATAMTGFYMAILSAYLPLKPLIDPSSYWFPRRRLHESWFLSSDTVTSLSLQTNTQMAPKEVPELDWLEEAIAGRFFSHIENAVDANDIDLTLELLFQFESRARTYATGFALRHGLNELKLIRSKFEKFLSQNGSEPDKKRQKKMIGLVDAWRGAVEKLCLESMRQIILLDDTFEAFFKANDWNHNSCSRLPAFLQKDIAMLQGAVRFEQTIYGRRLSRPRYLRQLLLRKLMPRYAVIIEEICQFCTQEILDFAEVVKNSGHAKAATQVLLAALHIYWKLPRWFDDVQSITDKYKAYEHYSDETITIPTIDFEIHQNALQDARAETIRRLSDRSLLDHLFDPNENDEFPDYFGQIYFLLAEECIANLDKNDAKAFNETFPMFLTLWFLADSRYSSENVKLNPEYRIHLISSIQIDLASILGFAILYDEYYENPDLSKKALFRYTNMLGKMCDDGADIEVFLERMMLFSDRSILGMALSPRAVIRTSWKQRFDARLRTDGYQDRYGPDSYRQRKHPNRIVNAFTNSFTDPEDLFLAREVLPKIDQTKNRIKQQVLRLSRDLFADGAGETNEV